MNVGHVQAEARIAHDQNAIDIKEGKAFAHGFDGVGEVLLRRLGLPFGLSEQGVGAVQQGERIFQFGGALADLIFEQRGAFELAVGGAVVVGGGLDPAHQRADDLQQFFVLAFGWVGGIQEGLDHGAAQGVGSGG